MSPSSSAEKANLQSHLNNLDRQSQQQAQDLPPSYENTLIDVPTSSPRPHGRSRQSQPRISIPTQNPLHSLQRLSRINFANYLTQIPASTLSTDQITVTTTHPELSSKQYALANFIREQAALPPKPIMVIRGFRGGQELGSSPNQVDFEIKANLTGLLDFHTGTEADGRGSSDMSRVRVKMFNPPTGSSPSSSSSSTPPALRVRPNESPLDAWIRTFTTDSSSTTGGAENRTFTISRVPLNLPVSVLEGHVRTLIAATRYRGKVTVEFPVLYRDVVVSRTSGNWFVKLVGLYNVRRFEVVQCVWTVGGATDDDEGHDGDATGGLDDSIDADREADRNARAGLVAQEWWNEWKASILNAVLGKKKGWITVEDWLEAKMGVREAEKKKDWGFDGM
ncbi:hypothetical protein PV10_07425 [Exophiala mesophila]|uniref:Uncharacterized protein n=1 Tax=Exophiala mesophila TaxID=212818 RepID=A0A0D1ZTI6_EXOME|nr:uncharacterized protein PV10_07425 [Exophiala mesophila]KIV90083.1 hypothetical protein PV10_07425 [Exophiala mesophila]